MENLIREQYSIPFINDLGTEYYVPGNGQAVVALTLAPRHMNNANNGHGGVMMSLLDVSMARAGATVITDAASGGATIEMKTSFLRPAGPVGTRLVATGQVIHHGATTVFCEASLVDGEERLIARASGTFKYKRQKTP